MVIRIDISARLRALALALGLALGVAGAACACPDDQYPGPFGVCLPKVGGAVGQASEHLKREIPAQVFGNPLEVWLNGSIATARSGAQPIPQQIRQMLTGYIDADILNRARYKVGDSGILNAAHAIEQAGDTAAVTLDNVIVFRGPTEANDPALWAHELTHVKQFRDWGVHSFAISYARNYNDVEDPAYRVGNNFWSWRNSHPQFAQQQVPQNFPPPRFPANGPGFPPPPPGFVPGGLPPPARFCAIGPVQACPMGVMVPVGSPCSCFGPYGPVPGIAR